MYLGLHENHQLFFSKFNDSSISRKIFEKRECECHQNWSGRSGVIPRERTDRQTDRRTDKTKVTVASRKFSERA